MKAHPVGGEAITAAVVAFLRDRPSAPAGEELDVIRQDVREVLEAANDPLRREHWREFSELLLGNEMQRVAGEAAFLDFDPDGYFEALDEPLRMSWEGNTAAGMEAAISKVSESLEGEQ